MVVEFNHLPLTPQKSIFKITLYATTYSCYKTATIVLCKKLTMATADKVGRPEHIWKGAPTPYKVKYDITKNAT